MHRQSPVNRSSHTAVQHAASAQYVLPAAFACSASSDTPCFRGQTMQNMEQCMICMAAAGQPSSPSIHNVHADRPHARVVLHFAGSTLYLHGALPICKVLALARPANWKICFYTHLHYSGYAIECLHSPAEVAVLADNAHVQSCMQMEDEGSRACLHLPQERQKLLSA